MPTNLEGLDNIDWASLTHAYGSARDIPGLIRARASNTPADAKAAEDEFFGNIYHQGTVYQATAPAVPFLINLLMDAYTCERAGLVMLLASIAGGTSFLEVHQDLAHYAKDKDKPETRAQLARELEWKALAHQAVQARAADYWKLLDDQAVRVAIPYLLSKLPGEGARVCAAAPRLIGSQGDDLFEASVLLSWVVCERPDSANVGSFLGLLRNADQSLLQLGGALGVLRLTTGAGVEDALGVYFDALCDPELSEQEDEKWFWGEGEFSGMLRRWISQFGPAARAALVLRLPSALPDLDDYTAAEIASETLALAFDIARLPQSKRELNPLQFALLQALTRVTNIIYSDPLIAGIQRALGLPNDMKRLKAFLQ